MPVIARLGTVLAITALLATVTGCAPAQDRSLRPTPSGDATATSPAPPTSRTQTELPPGPFADGDCGRVLDPATLKKTLGVSQNASVTDDELVLAVVGGIGCDFSFGTSENTTDDISVIVAPSTVADHGELAASLTRASCGRDSDGAGICTTTGAVAGWWYSLSDRAVGAALTKAQSGTFTTITASLENALEATTPPARMELVQPFHCSAVETVADPVSSTRVIPADHPQVGGVDEILAAAFLLAGPTTCSYERADWSLTVYPGGGSAYTQCTHGVASGGSSVSVPGVKSAFSLGPQTDGPQVCATDGKSTVAATADNSSDKTSWTPADLKSLGSLLVPVFRAASPSAAGWTASLAAARVQNTAAPLASGDCTKMLDALHVATRARAAVGDPLLATVGGIDCDYLFSSSRPDGTSELQLLVAPGAVADPAERAASLAAPACGADPQSADDSTICTETVAVAGWWFSMKIVSSAAPDDALAAFASMSGILDQLLKANTAPDGFNLVPPFDCPAIGPAGSSVTRSRTMLNPYFWNYGEIRAAAFLLAGAVTCTVTPAKGDRWSLTVYPGSALAYTECTHVWAGAHSKSVAVPGVKAAFALGADGSGQELCGTDGKSTVWVIGGSPEAPGWSTAQLKTVGSLLVPVLAAAS